jgi:hypothetical protein
MTISVYLSGPMRGHPKLNTEKFAMYAEKLRLIGYTVFSPPELSNALRVRKGLEERDWDETKGYDPKTDGLTFEDYYREDVRTIADVDVVAMLPGWETSTGARKEWRLAEDLGIARVWADELAMSVPDRRYVPFDLADVPWPETAVEEAQRLVHGDRNADYGHPADNDGRIAALMRALFGWPVKNTDVWQIMALTKLSRERSRPKHDNRVDLAGYAEVGDWIHRDKKADK